MLGAAGGDVLGTGDAEPQAIVWAELADREYALRESLTLLAAYDTFRLSGPCLAELAGVCARLGDARVVHARLAALAAAVPVTAGFARAAAALARSDAATLERAADGFAGQGLLLHAAEAAELAKELAAQCPAAATPLLSTRMTAHGLTRREREVVSLAARLGLSHAKLGVRGRAELRATGPQTTRRPAR